MYGGFFTNSTLWLRKTLPGIKRLYKKVGWRVEPIRITAPFTGSLIQRRAIVVYGEQSGRCG